MSPLNKCEIPEPSDYDDDDLFVPNEDKSREQNIQIPDKNETFPLAKDKKVDFVAGSDVISITLDEQSGNEDDKGSCNNHKGKTLIFLSKTIKKQ